MKEKIFNFVLNEERKAKEEMICKSTGDENRDIKSLLKD